MKGIKSISLSLYPAELEVQGRMDGQVVGRLSVGAEGAHDELVEASDHVLQLQHNKPGPGEPFHA